jgi:hypothetical protein
MIAPGVELVPRWCYHAPQWHSRMSDSSRTLIQRCCTTFTGRSWASWLDTTSNISNSVTTWTIYLPAASGSSLGQCPGPPSAAEPTTRRLSSTSMAPLRQVLVRRATSMFVGPAEALRRVQSLLRRTL